MYADVGYEVDGAWNVGPALATPWLLLAFSAGRQPRGVVRAALAGATTLTAGLGAYYGWLLLAQDVDPDTIVRHFRAPLWLASGVVVGACFGAVGRYGWARRDWVRALAWSVVVAVPVTDVLLLDRLREEATVLVGLLLGTAVALLVCAIRVGRVAVGPLIVGASLLALLVWRVEVTVLNDVFGFSY